MQSAERDTSRSLWGDKTTSFRWLCTHTHTHTHTHTQLTAQHKLFTWPLQTFQRSSPGGKWSSRVSYHSQSCISLCMFPSSITERRLCVCVSVSSLPSNREIHTSWFLIYARDKLGGSPLCGVLTSVTLPNLSLTSGDGPLKYQRNRLWLQAMPTVKYTKLNLIWSDCNWATALPVQEKFQTESTITVYFGAL